MRKIYVVILFFLSVITLYNGCQKQKTDIIQKDIDIITDSILVEDSTSIVEVVTEEILQEEAVFHEPAEAEMFVELFDKYKNAESITTILSQLSEGSSIRIYDVNKTILEDVFCQVNLYSSLGQTQYLVYKKDGENIWYFHKEVYIYEEPMKLENAEIINTYFKYINDLPYAFNEATGKYDIQADTNKYLAITDIRSLYNLIEIVINAIGELNGTVE